MTVRAVLLTVAVIVITASAMASDALLMDPDEHRLVSEPAVAIDHNGGMAVAWASRVAAGAQPLNGIRLQRFGPDGAAVGEVFRIDVMPGDLAAKPVVDIAPDGSRSVVVWEGGADGLRTKRRVWAQVFDAAGRPVGGEIRVDQRRMLHERWGLPREYYRDPKVSMASNGEFVVVWRSEGNSSCDRFNISARRFSPVGEPLGDEFIVNTERKWSQLNPDVDHDGSGGFVIVWQSGRFIGTDLERSSIHGRVFTGGGSEGGFEFILSPFDSATAAMPSLAVTPDGYFACAWKTGNGDEPLSRIEAGAFDKRGTPVGGLIDIEPKTPGAGGPLLAIVGPTEIMVAWAGTAEDRLKSSAVMARTFDVFGASASETFALSPATCWGVASPAVTAAYGEMGAVVWKIEEADRVGVRRFVRSAPTISVPLKRGGETFAELVDRSCVILGDHREDDQRQLKAAEVLSCMRGEAGIALPDLAACLGGDLVNSVKAECAMGIAAVADGPAQAVALLSNVIGDERVHADVRASAALAVTVFGEDAGSAIPALVGGLKSEDPEVRGNMALALGRIGAVSSIDAINSAIDLDTPRPFLDEMQSRFLTGVGEFGENEEAAGVVSRIVGPCLSEFERALFGKWRERSDPKRFGWHFRKFVRESGVNDEEKSARFTELAVARFREGRVGVFESPLEIEYRRFFEGVDGVIREYVEDYSSSVRRNCRCLESIAFGFSEVQRFPELAASRYSRILTLARSTPCLPSLLEIARRLGPGDPGVVEAIVAVMRDEDVPALEAIRALEATDPGCDECVVELRKLLAHPDADVREAAIGALIMAGLQNILSARDELTVLLGDASDDVRERAEQALALAEVESAICSADWRPALQVPAPSPVGTEWVPGGIGCSTGGPVNTPRPPQRGVLGATGKSVVHPPASGASPPPGSSPEPPRAVRTPVGGYTGKPKTPN